jgi:N-acetyl-alpha-D-muramate 1-phosphate uridylyltransferase
VTAGPPDGLCGIVLAAGEGRRLRPLTLQLPKALCPVDRRPLLDWALERLAAVIGSGPDRLAVNAYHLADLVLAELAGRATVSDERRGHRTDRAGPGGGPLGTAGALAALRDWVGGRDVLLTNADAYLPGGLSALLPGWDRERCRLLCARRPGHGDFGDLRYVGACLLPWPVVAGLEARPSGLYEVVWRAEAERGALDLVDLGAVAIDAGTPAGYLGANLDASGGRSVVGNGAVVQGRIERCVVWDGAWVGPGEHLVDSVRAGSRHAPVTVTTA